MSILLGGLAWLAVSFALSIAIGKAIRAMNGDDGEKGGDGDADGGGNQDIHRD